MNAADSPHTGPGRAALLAGLRAGAAAVRLGQRALDRLQLRLEARRASLDPEVRRDAMATRAAIANGTLDEHIAGYRDALDVIEEHRGRT